MECTDCHADFDPENLPHKEGDNISKVDCSGCHDTETFSNSIHAAKKVNCADCHSKHEIQSSEKISENLESFCLDCHKTPNVKNYVKSIHYEKHKAGDLSLTCTDCHNGSSHEIKSAKLSETELHAMCATCHENAVSQFEKSLHGDALSRGKTLAPNCITCHNSHYILSSKNENSKTYVINIPSLCGDCHKDGSRVSELKNISQRHILEDYSESIHGDGLYKRGLTVTAVCTSCHFSHNILPHENPESSINRKNISATCTQCHSAIERVHQKVIKGELWEKQPHMIPACIDCHQPHNVRRVFYQENYSDDYCMTCHSKKDLSATLHGETVSLFVNPKDPENPVHQKNTCVQCHTNIRASQKPVCKDSGPVDCSICHAEVVDDYNISIHGVLHDQNNPIAPYCTDCHTKHEMKSKADNSSPTFSRNLPVLCGKCHREGEKAAVAYTGVDHDIIKNYTMSIHGKGLLKSGLMVTATCIDCHSSHKELPASDPLSTVNSNNISLTCAKCHLGVYEEFQSSIHSPEITKTDKKLPGCKDCHESHTIERVDQGDFRKGIMKQCGNCHLDVAETYFETFHGKVSKLGSVKTARCHDCHGSHNILPTYDSKSTLSRTNVVETCKACHPNSNRMFVGYLTHATHHDKEKYPFLHYTFWFMTILLVSTFGFFGLHTLLWLPRALSEKRKHNLKKESTKNESKNE